MKKFFLMLVGSAFLISCESMRIKESCQETDWYGLGNQAGLAGFQSARATDAQEMKKCEEYEAKPNYTSYSSGLRAGLKRYCSADTARQIGEKGKLFNFQSCSSYADLKSLKEAHQNGVTHFCLNSGYQAGLSGSSPEVTCSNEQQSKFNSDFQMGRTEYMTQSMNTLKNQLSQVSSDIQKLRSENSDLERQNRRLEQQNRDLQRSLDDLEAKLRRTR